MLRSPGARGAAADHPAKLQLIIRALFEAIEARGLAVPGLHPGTVEAFPLFEVLDGKTSADYVQRVEPSVAGGRKMAKALFARLHPPA